MTNRSPLLASVLLLGGLAACQMPLAFQDPMTAHTTPAWQTQGRFRSATTQGNAAPIQTMGAQPQPGINQPYAQEPTADLLDWGGGVVDAPQEGGIRTVSGAGPHALQESVEGRMHIIELYQSVLDERDHLLSEVEALQAALEKTQANFETERGTGLTQGMRIEALEEAKRVLTEENRDLAGRLTKAQIRRLEAEKLLLETQIAWHREKNGYNGTAQQVANPDQPE